MAERSSTRKRSSSTGSGSSRSSASRRSSGSSRSSGNSRSSNGSSSRRSASKLSGPEAIERARESAMQLLGRPVESVLGLEPDDDGKGWKVMLEVVELERIPRSTDVLGAYVISLDKSGELTGARRERRYYRNQADEE